MESTVVPGGSVLELIAVNETLYAGPIVTVVVSSSLNEAGEFVDAVSITVPLLPEPLM